MNYPKKTNFCSLKKSQSVSPRGSMKDLHWFIRQCHSAVADKFVRDPLSDITNMSDLYTVVW